MSGLRKIKTFCLLIYYGICAIQCNRHAFFLDADETVKLILKYKRSLIRLGDGEFNILNGKSVFYQDYSLQLKDDLKKVIDEYLENKSNYILCMPGIFLNINIFKLTFKQFKSWAFSRYYFKHHYDLDIEYGDSFVFSKSNERIYELLWKDNSIKKIVFVHNNVNYANLFQEKYSKEVNFIKVNDKNSYNDIEDIEYNIISSIPENDKDNYMILISSGPSAKIIISHLSQIGYWCIDAGHCWDDPLKLRE